MCKRFVDIPVVVGGKISDECKKLFLAYPDIMESIKGKIKKSGGKKLFVNLMPGCSDDEKRLQVESRLKFL